VRIAEDAADAADAEPAVGFKQQKKELAVGDKVTHCFNKSAAWPETFPDGNLKMSGKPGKVYHAIVTQPKKNERYALTFVDDQDHCQLEATLSPEHEQTWWWRGWVGSNKVTKAEDVVS